MFGYKVSDRIGGKSDAFISRINSIHRECRIWANEVENSETTLRLQTLQARFSWRTVVLFGAVILILAIVALKRQGVHSAYYGALSAIGALALIAEYRRERMLVSNRLLAVGVVTDVSKPLRSRSLFVNAILSPFMWNIPLIKCSFVAFDQRTYTGQTGWGARGLYTGAQITILYNPRKPAANHALQGFIFYSFR